VLHGTVVVGVSQTLRRRIEGATYIRQGGYHAENTGCKNSPKIRHMRTIAQLCRAISSQLTHVSTVGRKLVKQQYLPICRYNIVRFGPLAAEIGSIASLGHQDNFNWFRVLAVLLHGTVVVGVTRQQVASRPLGQVGPWPDL